VALNNPKSLVAVPTHKRLEASDLVNLFSMPSAEEMAEVDEVDIACRECGRIYEVVLDRHTFNRGMCNSLLQHARTHLAGQRSPGIRVKR